MSFPVSPTNGQQSTIANIVYQYASATNSWTVVPGYANSITATGNIAANYFVGNGSALTGVIATGATALTYGTTNITTAPSGNANITIGGTSNVAVFSTGGANLAGFLNVTGNTYTGNILTDGYYYANGVSFAGGGGSITYTANTVPPASGNTVGSQWYNTLTGALFEYQDDGTSKYWVDVTGPTVANGSVTISTSSDGLSPFLLMGA